MTPARAHAPDDAPHPARRPLPGRMRPWLALPLLAVLLTGCGIRSTQVPTDFGPAPSRVPCALSGQDTATPSSGGVPVQVFLICSAQLVTVDRSVRIPDGTAEAARRVLVAQGLLDELAETPSTPEQQARYSTDVRGGMTVGGPHGRDPEDTLRLSTSPRTSRRRRSHRSSARSRTRPRRGTTAPSSSAVRRPTRCARTPARPRCVPRRAPRPRGRRRSTVRERGPG